jgi:TrmH family RNA methyltransferase
MSLSKNQIKYIKSLHQSKFRQMYENFIAEGDKVVKELIKTSTFEIEQILALRSWITQNQDFISFHKIIVFEISEMEMSQISHLTTYSSVFAIAKKKLTLYKNLLKFNYAFYLDGIQDPGNVGTIIRIADWFGIEAVIKSEDSADFFQPKVIQSTMGSLCKPYLIECNRNQIGVNSSILYSMDLDGENIKNISIPNGSIIILGNEGRGLSDELKTIIDPNNKIFIPGHFSKVAESLNVSSSAAIIANHIFSTN